MPNKFQKIKPLLKLVTTTKGRGLTPLYWLEALDPKHRPTAYLQGKLQQWKESNSKNNFFVWLDTNPSLELSPEIKETKTTTSEHKTTLVDTIPEEVPSVFYAKGKCQYFILEFKSDGLIYQEGMLFDTSKYLGKFPGYGMFVVEPDTKRFYASEYCQNQWHHSSFLNGERVHAAGMMRVLKGKLIALSFYSGHYRSRLLEFQNTLNNIPDKTIFNLQFVVCKTSEKCTELFKQSIQQVIDSRIKQMKTGDQKLDKELQISLKDDFAITNRINDRFLIFFEEIRRRTLAQEQDKERKAYSQTAHTTSAIAALKV